jgi:hypothetical protein
MVFAAALMTTSVVAMAGAAGADGPTAPGGPTSGVASPLNKAAGVTWKAPGSDGGSPITGYVVTPYQGSKKLKARIYNSPALAEVVPSLVNAKAYSFTVAARNAVGLSAPSPKTSGVIVGAPKKPGRPTVVRVSAGVFRITFAIPAANGARIKYFSGSCLSADHKTATNLYGTASPIISKAVNPGTVYTCTVKAANSRGRSPRSAASLPVKA